MVYGLGASGQVGTIAPVPWDPKQATLFLQQDLLPRCALYHPWRYWQQHQCFEHRPVVFATTTILTVWLACPSDRSFATKPSTYISANCFNARNVIPCVGLGALIEGYNIGFTAEYYSAAFWMSYCTPWCPSDVVSFQSEKEST